MTQGPSAGWYDDPAGSGGERWWDGRTWTDAVRARAQEPSLADLPPPVGSPEASGEGVAAPPRPRRRGLVAAAVVIPLLAAGGAVAFVLATGQSSVAATDGRLPDLADAPEVAWSADLREQFELVTDDLLADGTAWLADEARADPQGLIANHGELATWEVGDGMAVVLPTLDHIGNRLHGLDTTSGEVVWTTDPLSIDGTGTGWLSCTDLEATYVACVASHWDQHTEVSTSRLYVVDAADGTIGSESDIGRGERASYLTGQGSGAAIVMVPSPSRTTLTRYDTQGEQLWSTTFDGGGDVQATALGDLLRVRGYDHERGPWSEMIELDSGEPADGFERARPGDDLELDYTDWGGELLKLETDSRSGRRSVSILDDGEERWWFSSDAHLFLSSHVEAGAPVMMNDSDAQVVSALDPETGDERWVYRSRSAWPSLVLATRDQVVLRDDSTILSMDAATGDIEWRGRSDGGTSLRLGSSTLYELIDGHRMRAVELADGEERWSFTVPLRTDRAWLSEIGGHLALISGEEIHSLQ